MKAILVVDDDPDIRLLCRDRLEGWGYVVHSAASGEQALALLSTLEIHAMLLDLHLPGLEGAEVLRLIRGQGLALPILLISAAHSGQPNNLVGPNSAQGFLSKPFENVELEHWVRQWVGAPLGRSEKDMDSTAKSRYASRLLEVVAGIAVVLLLGCTTIPQAPHVSLAEALIGKSKQSLLACAGNPLREIPAAGGIVLNYYKEAPMFEESFMGSKGSRSGTHHGCWASISINDDRVIGVEYKSVPTPGIADDHCDEIFKNCQQ